MNISNIKDFDQDTFLHWLQNTWEGNVIRNAYARVLCYHGDYSRSNITVDNLIESLGLDITVKARSKSVINARLHKLFYINLDYLLNFDDDTQRVLNAYGSGVGLVRTIATQKDNQRNKRK